MGILVASTYSFELSHGTYTLELTHGTYTFELYHGTNMYFWVISWNFYTYSYKHMRGSSLILLSFLVYFYFQYSLFMSNGTYFNLFLSFFIKLSTKTASSVKLPAVIFFTIFLLPLISQILTLSSQWLWYSKSDSGISIKTSSIQRIGQCQGTCNDEACWLNKMYNIIGEIFS